MGNQARAAYVLAADFGAGSGRVVRGALEGRKLTLQEVHRFPNDPVQLRTELYWDFPRLFHELKQGMMKGTAGLSSAIHSIAVDTWGVDYGLIDGNGRLLANPRHYRDARHGEWMKDVLSVVSEQELYSMSGVLPQQINTIFQLFGDFRERTADVDAGTRLLFMPDLFHYYLSGEQACEYTIASTSGLLHTGEARWNEALMSRLGLPHSLFPKLVQPGSVLGALNSDLLQELRSGPMHVVSAGSHDTASALAAIPATASEYAFISCGTWSLMGIERDGPVLSDLSRKLGFTNEGTVSGKVRTLKNRSGLWLLQECKRQWQRENRVYSHEELIQLASLARPHQSFVPPGDEVFMSPGDMPQRIRQHCQSTSQKVPDSVGAIVRCILESLALEFRQTLDELEQITGNKPPVIHMVGGGVKNRLLCQFTANAAGVPVIAGPVEASAAGNCLMQYVALDELDSLSDAHEIAGCSFEPDIYTPEQQDGWQEAYGTYQQLNGLKEKQP
ncbi:rhamnulokinase [Paenibacillus silvae]|uniref:rhamnulokinase n=1 Tax=Paenibacillus silvae TaxID=1325358 RepID=UPI0020064DB2|nr:rhamnulokinase family protein [Paenibacillus silvae]MCK6077008.1 rhamnulokinase [Paenibacillus silvae]MCK6152768.1 rhamnulokinase [Paenibacillus silvae]MCK6269485.1 rhamnulokinase [Paenibacillus silvae]